jgi:hypothetical protein
LSIVNLGHRKQGVHGIISGDDEAGKVCQELTTIVEEDEEEIDESESSNHIHLGDIY